MDGELIHRRVLHAPRELVWRCITEPAELTRLSRSHSTGRVLPDGRFLPRV